MNRHKDEHPKRLEFPNDSGVEIAEPIADEQIDSFEFEVIPIKTRLWANLKLAKESSTAGFGMFSEAYFLFALGNVKAIWEQLYPSCFDEDFDNATASEQCNGQEVASLSYVETSMVMIGMLTFGIIASKIGRRSGSISTAAIMFTGAVLQTAASGPTLTGQFTMFLVGLAILAYGVGGEYPLASASAAERAHTNMIREREERQRKGIKHQVKHIRGKTVILTFAMQGWGNWVNTAFFVLFTAIFNCTGSDGSQDDCSYEQEVTWRLVYGLGTLLVFILFIGRWMYTKESAVWMEQNEKLEQAKEYAEEVEKSTKTKLLAKQFWHRMVGTGVGWFVWDVVFYGNKLFQAQIINNILGGQEASILFNLEYVLLNSSIALLGYYFAAFTADKQWMGRKRMQAMGFAMTFVLFLVCGLKDESLSQPENTGLFQFLYYLSSFFGQWGPNATTWLLPSELFPTEVRTEAHGFSAAMGKAGALTATLLFTFGNNGTPLLPNQIFLVCAGCGVIGFFLTIVFIPDVTTLDLSENDYWWEELKKGNGGSYEGPARHPKNLSWFERCMGVGVGSNIERIHKLEKRLENVERQLRHMQDSKEHHVSSAASEADATNPASCNLVNAASRSGDRETVSQSESSAAVLA